jgi:hypothetical protein
MIVASPIRVASAVTAPREPDRQPPLHSAEPVPVSDQRQRHANDDHDYRHKAEGNENHCHRYSGYADRACSDYRRSYPYRHAGHFRGPVIPGPRRSQPADPDPETQADSHEPEHHDCGVPKDHSHGGIIGARRWPVSSHGAGQGRPSASRRLRFVMESRAELVWAVVSVTRTRQP